MKAIKINIGLENVQFHFDSLDEFEITPEGIKDFIKDINNVLSAKFPHTQPQLTYDHDTDIIIHDTLQIL